MFLRRFGRLPKKLKAIYSLIILVVLAGMVAFIWAIATGKITPVAAPGEASLSLQSDSSTYNPGVNFTVYVNLDTGGVEISEVAIKSLNYNTSVLDVIDQDETSDGVQITPGSLENLNTIENYVDTLAGKITYIAQISQPTTPDTPGFNGSGRVATINFMAKAAGTSTLSFDFTAGTIGDTDVITKVDGSDILTSAAAMSITVVGSESHKACNTANQTCENIDGAGVNQCSNDADCQVSSEHHYVCYAPKKVCLKKSGSGTNECQTYADCLKPPPTPPTPTPEPSPTEEVQPTETPTEEAVVTPTPEVIASPLPSSLVLVSPTEFISPQMSPETKIGGFAISNTWALVLYIGVPVLITGTIFLIWWWRKKKKESFLPPSEKEEEATEDDDEII
jgi:hypothetical protein